MDSFLQVSRTPNEQQRTKTDNEQPEALKPALQWMVGGDGGRMEDGVALACACGVSWDIMHPKNSFCQKKTPKNIIMPISNQPSPAIAAVAQQQATRNL
jgi:hypothetical protein